MGQSLFRYHRLSVLLIALVVVSLVSVVLAGCNRTRTSQSNTVTDASAPTQAPVKTSAGVPWSLAFQDGATPVLPLDVDMDALEQLGDIESRIPEAQRVFDTFAWQNFAVLNWPANAEGQPDATKTIGDSQTPRVWEYFRETSTVFLPNGGEPAPWGADDTITPGSRNLKQTSKVFNVNHPSGQLLDESLQAFTGPLVDQNGNWVYYEVLINKTEFDYIREHALYSQEGQAAFTAQQPIDFPANTESEPGSMELKFAWKILGNGDIPDRFFTREATILVPQYDKDGKPLEPKEETRLVGLVGMHISVLTQSSPEWIWATFEHVDNVQANSLETGMDIEGNEVRVRPNFNNPDLPTKEVNTLPPTNAVPVTGTVNGVPTMTLTGWDPAKTKSPTQALRMVPIPKETLALNAEVQAALKEAGSVFQYYELIGTQWPVNPNFPAFAGGVIHYAGGPLNGDTSSPESLIYKTPGKMVPVLLTNMAMETFFQQGNQAPGGPERDDRLPANFGNAVQDPTGRVFYTESCVGCHYSAGAVVGFKRNADGELMRDSQGYKIPIYGENSNFGQTGNAHFSWLLQMKARQTEPPIPPAR